MAKPGPNVFSSQRRLYCVERRDAETGALDLRGKQPPFVEATEDQLVKHFFRSTPDDGRPSANPEEIGKWYSEQGWFWRPKTW